MSRPRVARPDPGLFGPDSMTWRVHGDPAMALAGFRALLLQAVHPLVMAGFDASSAFRDDPWGRLPPGVEPETGRSWRVDDPELLLWVHCTEVESFLSTYRRCGGLLDRGEADRYVAEMVTSARLVGLDPAAVPATEEAIEEYYRRVRPQLRVTSVARRNALWGFAPPMPGWVQLLTPARPAWAALVGMAGAMLPRWARRLYGLPALPATDLAATLGGRALRTTLTALPEPWIGSPARRAALDRLSAA